MRSSPYEVYGGALGTFDPVLLSVSGGRTSGMLLYKVLEAYDFDLPPMVHPVFMNTGREMNETLDFVAEMGERWNVKITWLERDFELPATIREVSHNSASRNGEPFDALIRRRKFVPNRVTRYCTTELKVRAAAKWMQARGYEKWANIVGFRADEAHRLLPAQRGAEKQHWYTLAPMVDAGVTKRDVVAFWAGQPFDLRLPNVNGKTPLGNCDGCFLKGDATLVGIAREHPERFAWWTRMEAETGATFRGTDRINHTQIADMVARQGDMIADLDDENLGIDCFCHGD